MRRVDYPDVDAGAVADHLVDWLLGYPFAIYRLADFNAIFITNPYPLPQNARLAYADNGRCVQIQLVRRLPQGLVRNRLIHQTKIFRHADHLDGVVGF